MNSIVKYIDRSDILAQIHQTHLLQIIGTSSNPQTTDEQRTAVIDENLNTLYRYTEDEIITTLQRGFYDYKAILGIPEDVRTLFEDNTPTLNASTEMSGIDVYLSPSKVLSVQGNTLYATLSSSALKTLIITGDVQIIESIRFYEDAEKQREIETAVFLEADEPTAVEITRESLPLYTKICLTYKSLNAEAVPPLRGGINKVGGVLNFRVQSGADFKEFSVRQSPLVSQTLKKFFAMSFVKNLVDMQRISVTASNRVENMIGDFPVGFLAYHTHMRKEIETQKMLLEGIPSELYESKRPINTGHAVRPLFRIYGGDEPRLPEKEKRIKL